MHLFLLLCALIDLVDHRKLCVLIGNELFRQVEVLHQKQLQLTHNTIVVVVFIQEVAIKSILRRLVATNQQRNTNQKGLLEYFHVLRVLDVLAQELDAAYLHEDVLPRVDDLTVVLAPVLTFPVGCRRDEVLVLHLD